MWPNPRFQKEPCILSLIPIPLDPTTYNICALHMTQSKPKLLFSTQNPYNGTMDENNPSLNPCTTAVLLAPKIMYVNMTLEPVTSPPDPEIYDKSHQYEMSHASNDCHCHHHLVGNIITYSRSYTASYNHQQYPFDSTN